MNPTVDWIWYTAICHNNVNAGFGACYLIAQFQNHQKEHFKGRFEAHIPKDESLVVVLKLTVLFFFFLAKSSCTVTMCFEKNYSSAWFIT